MSVLPVGFGAVAAGDASYQIDNSLRFRASASAYLSRTFGSPTTQDTFTLSAWVKRGTIGVLGNIFGVSTNNSIGFPTANTLVCTFAGTARITTTALYRDPSAWMHIVYKQTTGAGELYVNGTSVGTTATVSAVFNTNVAHQLGAANTSNYYDGYLSAIYFIDGQALSSSYFGELNSDGVWVPKAYTGTYGTNGFYLDFSDATSTTTLGYDAAGSNDWTCNNISLTAGVTYDHMTDTPTNNFATLNPIYPSAANISYANLRSGTTAVRGTVNANDGSGHYWEVTAAGSNVTAGVVDDTTNTNTTTVTANKVFGFRLTATGDLDYINITDAGSWTSITTGLTGNRFPYGVTQAADWNFGQRPWIGSASGSAINTANLPAVDISGPSEQFDVVLDTGANIRNTAEAVFPYSFLEWIKDRANSNNHQLIDTVRGNTAILQSNTTSAETSYSTPSGSSVAWVWKTGGAPASNTDGSITSDVSANQTAGFSIVAYTGNNTANQTVGHGLNKAPSMIIVKRLSGVYSWMVQHIAVPATHYMVLNSTAAQSNAGTYPAWDDQYANSTVFYLDRNSSTNSVANFIAYCLAEIPGYSKFGGYTGNGNADGTFVYCGFRPKWVMTKSTASTSSWQIYDAERPGYNVQGGTLIAEGSGAESTTAELDILANGFKARIATDPNVAEAYIFAAFAEHPFGGSNVSPSPAR